MVWDRDRKFPVNFRDRNLNSFPCHRSVLDEGPEVTHVRGLWFLDWVLVIFLLLLYSHLKTYVRMWPKLQSRHLDGKAAFPWLAKLAKLAKPYPCLNPEAPYCLLLGNPCWQHIFWDHLQCSSTPPDLCSRTKQCRGSSILYSYWDHFRVN